MQRPLRQPPREAPVRTFTEWSPTLIKSAEILADGGNLRLASDLVEAMLGDDRVSAVLGARVRSLLGKNVSFEAGCGRRRKAAMRALEAGEDWWAAFPESSLARLLSWGIMLGVSPGTLTWQAFVQHDPSNPTQEPVPTQHGGRTIPLLDARHARHLRFDPTYAKWCISTEVGEVDLVAGDGTWVLYTPYGSYRPWSQGAWRGLARWFLLKQYALTDFARHSEVHGTPIRAAIPPEGKEVSPKLRTQLASDLGELGNDTSIVMPPGVDLKLIEATAKTWEMFQAQIDMANKAITILIAGQNLTTEVSGGSYAAARVHEGVLADEVRADAESLSTTLHDQVLTHWARINFGAEQLAPWPVWDLDPPEDIAAIGAGYRALGDGIAALQAVLAGSGKQLDVEALLEEHGLDLIDVSAPTVPSAVMPNHDPQAANAKPAATAEASAANGIEYFAYDLDAGVVTVNEARKSKGLAPVDGGDAPASVYLAKLAPHAPSSLSPEPAAQPEQGTP